MSDDTNGSGANGSHAPRRGRLTRLEVGESIGAARGDCVVCIPLFGAYAQFAECLRSVLRHTPAAVPVVVADDASPDPSTWDLLRDIARGSSFAHHVIYVRSASNRGFVENVNDAMGAAAPADVVLLNSDCVVGAHWLDGLRAAAYSGDVVATATALSNNATIVSVRGHDVTLFPVPRLPPQWTLDSAADAIWRASLRLRPRLPVAIGHCMYVRRTALDLVGDFDRTFSPGYGEEVDFSMRCEWRGLQHVLADDVFVLHEGSASFRQEAVALKEANTRLVLSRYPEFENLVEDAVTTRRTPLARALGTARRTLTGISVTVDATCLGAVTTGTQVHTLELIHALWRRGDIHLRALVGRQVGADNLRRLRDLAGLELLWVDEVSAATPRTDVIHRPWQVATPAELDLLRQLGEHVVVTQQDVIAYQHPSYFTTHAHWRSYADSVIRSLAAADAVLFFSEHARDDAVAEGVVEPERTRVVYVGTDHQAVTPGPPRRPAGADALAERGYLLCLGHDFPHKNRLFALEVLDQLQRRHAWRGRLVLAGARAAHGSSAGDEARFLLTHPEVEGALTSLGSLEAAEVDWLMRHALAVIYPTLHEGFGLVPFEAAERGVPCVFASHTSLAEILPPEASRLVRWEAAATADNIIELERDEASRARVVGMIREAATRFRWDEVAQRVVDGYWAACDAPPRGVPEWPSSPACIEQPAPAAATGDQLAPLSRQLVAEAGALPIDVQQALWAIARRPWLNRAFYAGLRSVHRAGLVASRRTGRSRRR